MKIGIFDSGFGGLSVLNLAMKRLEGESFLYYADRKNVPYGIKSREEILKFTSEATRFLIEQGAQAIVVACNTATSVAITYLRANFNIPIIGMEPAVKKAVDTIKNGANLSVAEQNLTANTQNNTYFNLEIPASRTLVIATPVTVAGAKLKELIKRIDGDECVDLLALPGLVEFAEKEELVGQNVREYLREQLKKFDLAKYGSLVLGCTHFNYFKDSLREILPPQTAIIDGIEGTINRLISELERLNLQNQTTTKNLYDKISQKSQISFFYSGELVCEPAELDRLARYLKRLDEMAKIS